MSNEEAPICPTCGVKGKKFIGMNLTLTLLFHDGQVNTTVLNVKGF